MPPSQAKQPFQPYAAPPTAPAPQNSMKSNKSRTSVLLTVTILLALLLVGSAAFAIWAYSGMQDYKNNSDKKAASAVDEAVKAEASKQEAEFAEKEKNPLKTYKASSEYGSLSVSYPKTWSAYIVESDKGAKPIDGYLHPDFVPGTQSQTAYALRIEVSNQSYDQEMKKFEALVKTGKVSVAPYIAKNVPGVTGSRVDGEINQGQKNSMILVPIRDKTIKISTESQQFLGDFNDIILPNLSFVP